MSTNQTNDQTGKPSNGVIGKPINRVDGRLKVTGGAHYAVEFPLENIAYAVLVSSTIANGRVSSFDASEAKKVPGVLTIITYENAPKLKPIINTSPRGDAPDQAEIEAAKRRVPLQSPVVYFDGQYIAVVVADTLEQAQRAAQLLRVNYDKQPPATDMEKERNNARAPKKVADKPADSGHGNVEAGLASAEVRVEETYITPTEHHNPMEPHATTAVWDGDKLTIYDATQYTYGVRHSMAATFGIPEENVHVICKFTGGAFGCKGTVWPHVSLAAAAAQVVKRPVRLATTRQQMFANMGHRSETKQRVTLAAKRKGQLTAIIHEGLTHTSTFDEFIEPFSKATHMMYACENLKASQRVIPLNIGTPTYMRAPGESSGMFGLESAMDELAYKLKIDPIQLRLINHADKDPESGLPWSTKLLKESYQLGAERFGWSKRNPQPRSMRDGRHLIGMGMATAVYPVNHMPSSARVRILADGSAIAESSTHELGTGVYTILTQIAAETLGLPTDRVQVFIGDTNLPKAMVSGGSSTTMSVGTSVQGAAKAAIAKLVEMARADNRSPLFGANADQITAKDGRLVLKDNSSKGERFGTIVARAGMKEIEASFDTQFDDKNKTHSSYAFGAQFAEVRVDPDFGEVRMMRYTGVFDIGRVMNMKTARSQMIGGIVMGIGMALTEATILDTQFGRIVNHDFAEYHVPVNADIPDIDVHLLENFDEHASAIGAKGAGEIGIVGTAAAVANAVYHATGVRVRELPITPDKLLGIGESHARTSKRG